MSDTIFARASGAGRAAVAIIRISGPGAGDALAGLAGSLPPPRLAAVRTLRNRGGEQLDQALVIWMPGPASFTGEDCAELHVHGGRAVVEGVSAALTDFHLRPAQPGEFSRRAFAHGKLDLLQAEAVADLVDAETDTQRRQALGQLEGAASRRYQDWRSRLITALALIEAEIDFPDDDLPGAVSAGARPLLTSLTDDLASALQDSARGRQVRDGYRIAIVGAPNAGKSSLFNALVERDAAIVSARPGTTRDVVEARLVLGGFSVTLADTAGLRRTGDDIEAEGIRRARRWAADASLRLLLVEPGGDIVGLQQSAATGDFLVLSKADQAEASAAGVAEWAATSELIPIEASVVAPEGLDALRENLLMRVEADLGAAEQPAITRARHEQAIRHAQDSIAAGLMVLSAAPDRAAEDVRAAARALEAVVGRVDREAVLDEVFSAFCIGK